MEKQMCPYTQKECDIKDCDGANCLSKQPIKVNPVASPCALCEGKEKELKEVSKALNEMTGDWLQKGRRITELEKECEGKEKEIAELKNKCDSDHVSIDDLLSEFDRRGFKTDNWDGDAEAPEAIVSGVKNHIDELTHYQSQRISELEAEKEKLIMLTRKLMIGGS